MKPLVLATNLVTHIDTPRGRVTPVAGVSLEVAAGEVLGVVGETGSGKSQLVRALMGLLSPQAHYAPESRVMFEGVDITRLSEKQLRFYWGRKIALIPQDPATSLNPVRKVGAQLMDSLGRDSSLSAEQRRARAIELFHQVGIADPVRRLELYPHEMSGGMRQRVLIAIAISLSPALLVADEPTTALDVTIQRQVLDLIQTLQTSARTSVILVSHDLAVVAGRSDRVAVMYSGKIVENLDSDGLKAGGRHPYTRGLIGSQPRNAAPRTDLPVIPGEPPDIRSRSPGCPFEPRCIRRLSICTTVMPAFVPNPGRTGLGLACHNPFPVEVAATSASPAKVEQ